MGTSYTYSASRVKTIERLFLTAADIERLLSAAPGAELVQELKDTYLSEYIAGNDIESVFKALEQSKIETKILLEKISPKPTLFDFVWVRYDFHNLRLFLRAKAAGLSLDEVRVYMSTLGTHNPDRLHELVESGSNIDDSPEKLDADLKAAYKNALKVMNEKEIAFADIEMDKSYFAIIKKLADKSKNSVIKEIVKLQIDLFNLKTKLRILLVPRVEDDRLWFVEGGSFSLVEIETKEKTVKKLKTFGDEKYWREALLSYEKEGNLTSLDAKIDDYLLSRIIKSNQEVFSFSTLLAHVVKVQNMALIIQAIVAGKDSGQNELAIREQLRTIYV